MVRIIALVFLAYVLTLATWGIVAAAWISRGVVEGLGPAVGGFFAALVLAFFSWRLDVAIGQYKVLAQK